jgi:hypothetical protein
MLKEITNGFFDRPRGLIIDNSYETYTLNSLIKYFKENQIEFLYSQDNDLGYLKHFKNVKYLSIPCEATNFKELNELNDLKGLCLFSSSLNKVAPKVKEKLEYLEIIYDNATKADFSIFKSLKHLRINGLPHDGFEISKDLETLELEYCKRVENLDFLENVEKLKRIKLSYLPKLENIDYLQKVNNTLESVDICDCKNITNIEKTLGTLIHIKDLQVITTTTDPKLKFKSLEFLSKLLLIDSFSTNYKIEDGNLNNLLKLKDTNITAFYKNYNLGDKDLPHISVLVNIDGEVSRIKLDSLELGKDDTRIIWLQ